MLVVWNILDTSSTSNMVKFLLYILIALPQLAPPGVCLCHVFEDGVHLELPNRTNHSDSFEEISLAADEHEEDSEEHSHGCPARRDINGQCLKPVFIHTAELPFSMAWGELNILHLPPLSLDQPMVNFAPILPGQLPIYLNVRALLI